MNEPITVRLGAAEPGEPVPIFPFPPLWFLDAVDEGDIRPVSGDSIDGSDWTYLLVQTSSDVVVAKTDDYINLEADGDLSVTAKE